MPIRMEKDRPDPRRNDNNDPRPPQPPGRKKGMSMPLLLGAMFLALKKPKLLIPIIILIALVYVCTSGVGGGEGGGFLGGDESQTVPWDVQSTEGQFTFGAELSEEEYDKAEVFEALAVGYGAGIPRRAILEDFAPPILHQGRQGSCSGWASAYGARTIAYAKSSGQKPIDVAFSPSFLYNQIALPRCQGAYLRDAMESMLNVGSLPFDDFAYNERTCSVEPEAFDKRAAGKYRIKGYQRLTQGSGNYTPDLNGIKQHLAQGAPVVIGMMVGQTFQGGMRGRSTWQPSRSEYNGMGLGGHAMCVIGYDDNHQGGSFRIMNSWGKNWGDRGFCWVKYADFRHFVKEAYGLYPEGNTPKFDKNRMQVKFGLVENETQALIPLTKKDEIVFRTRSPIRIGDKFKIAITNDVECYTYVFGMESDGSSYTLFPYTSKHSGYSGITGTRLFPKDYSMTADDIGNKDYIAVVVSKEKLNYTNLNRAINSSRGSTYMERVVEALYDKFVLECDLEVQEGGAVYLNCETKDERNTIATIIEIDKR